MTVFDIAILALLAVLLALHAIQARRVKKLLSVLREMQPMFENFSSAVDRSEETVAKLSRASAQVSAAVGDDGTVAVPQTAPLRKMVNSKSAAVSSFYDHARGRSRA